MSDNKGVLNFMSKQVKQNIIDFVIAWVDGNDKEWLAEKIKYQTTSIYDDDCEARYRDWDNLQHWFRAVERYAPWVRTIHFVTWGHIPAWMNVDNPKLHIVKHEDYIPAEYLPTFNSHTIELNLHRIPGLAEQFVYFNDDMFLNHAMKPEDFFKNGLPRDIFGLDCIPFGKNSAGMFNANNVGIINDHFNLWECIRQNPWKWLNYRYGIKVPLRTLFLLHKSWFPGFYYQHLTSNFLKSTFDEVWEKEGKILDATCKCKFRTATNVNQWLMKYWQLASGNFYPRKKKMGYYYGMQNDITDLLEVIKNESQNIICINDTMKTVNFEEKRDALKKAFENKFPEKSSFEKE